VSRPVILDGNPAYLAALFCVVEALLYEACDAGLPASDVLRKVRRAGYIHGVNLGMFGPEPRDIAHVFASIRRDLEELNLEAGRSGGYQTATREPPQDSP
jgi:sugar phosphate isomerase/epimerase